MAFNKHLLNAYGVPSTTLGLADHSRSEKIPVLGGSWAAYVLLG